jgi:general secretion pathway protein L
MAMTILPPIQEGFSRWISSVAGTVNGLSQRLRSRHDVQLIEEAPDSFTLRMTDPGTKSSKKSANKSGKASASRSKLPDQQIRIVDGVIVQPLPERWAKMLRGSRVEIVLRPNRFLFRPLELPRRAVEFLDGIVRAQIDRLTPWTSAEAVFGWTPPVDAPNDRIELTIAATARALIAPYVQAIAGLGVGSVAVLTAPSEAAPDAVPLKVLEHHARGVFEVDRIRQALVALLLISALAAAGTTAYSVYALDSLDAEQQDLNQKIAARRSALRTGPAATATAQRALERRKHTTPSNVIVVEALSQILPDHTYVTELRIEGDKLQIVGVTRDAASLIGLIEQSPHFEHAAFYAPTTRTPGDPGERFHVEAHIKPVFAVGT